MAKQSGYENIEIFAKRSFIFDRAGLLRQNKFVITFDSPPSNINFSGQNVGEMLQINAMAVQCPNIAMEVTTTSMNTWFNHTYRERTDMDLRITFLDTADMHIRRFFNEWIRLGYDIQTSKRHYFEEIRGRKLTITPLQPNGEEGKYSDVFFEILPFAINDINYDLRSENALHYTEVDFKFITHDIM